MSMNLSQLRYALAVADTGSFTLAAERCYVTQPTLSNGIAQLEQELEQRLFLRTTRSVSLTDFGKRMLPFINGVLTAQERMVQAAHDSRPEHRILRIGTSPLIKSDWLAALLEGFRREHPETSILLHEQNMADLYRMLDEGRLDFVFGVEGMHKPDRSTLPLYTEPLYFIPRGKRNPVAEPARLEEVAGETFIMVPDACGLAQATRKLFRSHRCSWLAFYMSDEEAGALLVESGASAFRL